MVVQTSPVIQNEYTSQPYNIMELQLSLSLSLCRLTRQICTYDLALRFPQYFSGSTGRLVLAYAYFCNDGLVPLRLGPGAYICEVDQGLADPGPEPIVATPAPTEGNEGRPGVTTTERPTTQGPTERPTTAALSECPSDGGYTRNNYTFNSL